MSGSHGSDDTQNSRSWNQEKKVLMPHTMPVGPRPHRSALPSPSISASRIVDQYSGPRSQTPSAKSLPLHTRNPENATPFDVAHHTPFVLRMHRSALPSPSRS